MQEFISVLNNGLRLVVKTVPYVRSVAVGVMVGVGSANETADNNGISHFLEHMFFKGTKTRDAFEIAAEIEGLGAQINAYTSKQATCFYTLSTDDQTEKCMEVLSDILFNSLFDEDEAEREKKVVLEEISMSEDDPSDVCLETLSTAYFKGNSLALPILGSRKNVEGFSRKQLLDFIAQNYCAANTVIAIAGNITKEKAVKLVRKHFNEFKCFERADWKDKKHITTSCYDKVIKDVEQANIAFAFPSFPYNDKNEAVMQVVNNIIGGGMSSRLFQELREKQGLAYSVYSYPSTYINNAYETVYIGTNVKMAAQAVKSIRSEIIKLKQNGITQKELERGKQQIKSAHVMGQESTTTLMRLYAKNLLFADKLYDIDEHLEKINKVTLDDAKEALCKVFDFSCVSAAYAGRELDFNPLELIKG